MSNSINPNWPKCPKCKNNDMVMLTEIWDRHVITWDAGDKQDEGVLDVGDPYKVEGHCSRCNKHWRIRGEIQVNPAWWDQGATKTE
jgi:hypothetical protein